jgi:hypothetical protein
VNAGNRAGSYDSLLTANGISRTTNTDWFDAVLRQGQYAQYNLNASGGNDKSTYFVSGSYYNSEAPTKGLNYDKATYRINISSELTKKLSFKGGFSGRFRWLIFCKSS